MLPKCTHLLECKVDEKTSLYEHSNESIEINTVNTNNGMKNPLFSYDLLILEANFHDVWVKFDETLYWDPIG